MAGVGEATPLLEGEHLGSLEGLDFDRLLAERLGEFGWYQRVLYLLLCLPAALTAAITMASVFTAYSPPHRCLIPACDDPLAPAYTDPTFFGWSNFTLPSSDGRPSPCQQRAFTPTAASCPKTSDWTPPTGASQCVAGCFANTTSHCPDYVFQRHDMATSLVTDFGLVCEEKFKVPLSQSVFFAGVLVGALLFGMLGDRLGRRACFLLGLLLTTAAGLGAAFAPGIVIYSGLMFLTAMGQVGVFQCGFVLAVETVGPSWRVFCGVFIEFFFVSGELVLALLAWWLRDWRKLQLAVCSPGIIFLFYYFFLPQSVRWLVQQGRHADARRVIGKVARWNGARPVAEEELQRCRAPEAARPPGGEGLRDLFRRPVLRARLLNVGLNWAVITLIYYGLSMNAASLAGDIFTNFALLAAAELPGYTLCYLGMRWAGRRATLASSLLLGGLACLAASLAPASLPALGSAFYLLGKFGATAAFGTTYLYTSELFPTGVRNVCLGLSSMCGRLGAIVSPYVASLGLLTGLPWLPMAVFAALAILSGILTLALPETLGLPLPGTMQEAEELGKEGRSLLVNSEDERQEE